jgi:hypothetical protein
MHGKRNPNKLLVAMYINSTPLESSMEIPQKTITELPYNIATPLLGIYPKECKPG